MHHASASGLSRIDLLASLVAVASLLLVMLPHLNGGAQRRDRAICFGNLQQLGIAVTAWSMDHEDRFPWLVSSLQGGSIGGQRVVDHWRPLSNHLRDVKFLTCPANPRRYATSFASMQDHNMSYGVGSDSQSGLPGSFLASDFDLEGGYRTVCGIWGRGRPLGNVFGFSVITGQPASATSSWSVTNHVRLGNILTADGSVHATDTAGLRVIMSANSGHGGACHYLPP
ncbi:MAG: hypothetical protein FJ405_12370 [Verrucomicrobia bacterium]|nr:hypothetical protein [Verrucomicrobiota bacterium]